MNRRLVLPLLAALCLSAQTTRPAAPRKPKLLLLLVVDQFRGDYVFRYREQYNAGLDRLLRQGAHFSNAHFEHFPTVTAVGHSTILSGATPSVSGIVGNEWFDRETAKSVSSVVDSNCKLLGASGACASPHRLLVSTIGDELKMKGGGSPKSIGISLKDRSAILPVGRTADGAFWYHSASGNFVSSTWYFPELPAWAAEFNRARIVEQFLGKSWTPLDRPGAEPFLTLPKQAGKEYFEAMSDSPWGNELVRMLAERAIDGEKLGQRGDTDLLSLSFSSNDGIGHDHGPDDPRVRDVSIRTDRTLGELFAFLEKRVGMQNVLVVLTADHGVSPTPEAQKARRMPGGRIPEETIVAAVEKRLSVLYGSAKWVIGRSGPSPYLNHALIEQLKLDPAQVRREAAEAVRAIPHIARVYTREDLLAGPRGDVVDRRVRAGFHQQRAADLYPVADPYYTFGKNVASHGSAYNYDSHVPVILMGPGIKPGRYPQPVAVNDIAPTLAELLDLPPPSGSSGRPLWEVLTR
jgi:predicted AlkP superfamily pyrophosphatase or phosphodiesterase